MSDKKYNNEEMVSISKTVMRYLDAWQLTSEEIIVTLGLDEKLPKRHLQNFRSGSKVLPQETEVMQRIEHVAGIVDALRTAYPMNAPMRERWVHKPCRRFQGNTPLSAIMTQGMNGLVNTRIEIDCAYGWELSEKMNINVQSK
jgi:ethanolamine transporter EutH